MKRYIFQINTDTGTQGDTGKDGVFGEIAQIHWNPTTADTGGDLKVALLPRQGDTGDGFEILNNADCLGANFNRVPRQVTHDISGAPDVMDTGTPADPTPYFGAGDRLRVKVIPGGAAVVGRLYVWVKD